MATINSNLIQVITDLGFSNLEAFVKEQLRKELTYKVESYQEQIVGFEEKYNCDWETFQARELVPTASENFTHWDDSIEWEWAVSSLSYYQDRLNRIEDA